MTEKISMRVGESLVAGGPPGTAIGMLLGEILGEFIGTFIYEVFNGDASGKKGVGLIVKKIVRYCLRLVK